MLQDTSIKIHPSELKHFLRHVCMVSHDHKEREKAREDLDNQLKRIKKISLGQKVEKGRMEKEIKQLKEKINILLKKEGKLLKYIRVDENTVRQLNDKIKKFEKDLSIARSEKDKANIDNKEEIKIIADSINHIKTKMHEIIKAKRYREDKIRELEEKVKENTEFKHPSP